MKYILAFIIFLILPLSAQAAEPNATLSRTKDGKFMNVSFSDLKSVSKVAYIFTYDNNRRQTGIEGGFRTTNTSRATRKLLLGTCSTKRCVYHQSAKNFELTVTYHLKNGEVKTLTKRL